MDKIKVFDGEGLVLENGRSVKFSDIARKDCDGKYAYPPVNAGGDKIPFISNDNGRLSLIVPVDSHVRYKHWSNKTFTLTIADILKIVCVYELDEWRDRHLGVMSEFKTCRDCTQCSAVNSHVSTSTCKLEKKPGKFKAGSFVCHSFKSEWHTKKETFHD